MGVAADDGDIPLVEPSRTRDMHSGGGFLCVPLPLFRAPCPASRADEDDVARADFDAGLFLPRIEVRRINGSGQFQILHA